MTARAAEEFLGNSPNSEVPWYLPYFTGQFCVMATYVLLLLLGKFRKVFFDRWRFLFVGRYIVQTRYMFTVLLTNLPTSGSLISRVILEMSYPLEFGMHSQWFAHALCWREFQNKTWKNFIVISTMANERRKRVVKEFISI